MRRGVGVARSDAIRAAAISAVGERSGVVFGGDVNNGAAAFKHVAALLLRP